jgi:DMSO/TMAO reductase YedYZ heme-binding membrane subunit
VSGTLYIADQKFDLARVASEIIFRIYLTIGFAGLLGLAHQGEEEPAPVDRVRDVDLRLQEEVQQRQRGERVDLARVASEIIFRIYLTIGFAGLLGLVVLGVTSTASAAPG